LNLLLAKTKRIIRFFTMDKELKSKVISAVKWSAIAEILYKIITPLLSVILARLLTPEAFGIVATFTMIITLSEIFSDAGFQKYIVQHDFSSDEDLNKGATVAFWSNLSLSVFIWLFIFIFSTQLCEIVGSRECEKGLILASLSIPLVGFSSIQTALFKRSLDFKALFKVKMCSVFVPLFVTIPLAIILRSYWALVIGTLSRDIVNAIVLSLATKWKPRFFFSILLLKEMISFSIWSMIETFSIWLTHYVDIFFVGAVLSQYYLGLYKTSMSIIGQILGLITAIVTPIIFSTLSKMQNDDEGCRQVFYRFQRLVAILVLPLGALVFSYRDLITDIILGKQWSEASDFIGLWALSTVVSIATTRYCSELYRAKGHPKMCFLAQFLHLIVLVPGIIYFVHQGFKPLYIFRSLVVLELVAVNMILSKVKFGVRTKDIILNIRFPFLASATIILLSLSLRPLSQNLLYNVFLIIFCVLVYSMIVFYPRENRQLINTYILKKK